MRECRSSEAPELAEWDAKSAEQGNGLVSEGTETRPFWRPMRSLDVGILRLDGPDLPECSEIGPYPPISTFRSNLTFKSDYRVQSFES